MLNILIIILVLAGITYFGHVMSGKKKDKEGFFTGNGGLPWWAVSSSILATVVSSVTFISVPTSVFREGGNLGYIQVLFGLMLAKILVAIFFARPYYLSEGIETTYDYIGKRTDSRIGAFAMVTGLVMSALNTSIKVLTAGLVLTVISGYSMAACIFIIVGLSILWSAIAGISSVIWTDFALFILFTFGAIFSVFWSAASIDISLVEAIQILDDKAKLVLFDFSLDPAKSYTLWAGIIGGVAISLAQVGSQSTMQRIKACRSPRDAQIAYSVSAAFYLTPMLMLAVGLALSVFYHVNPVPAELAEKMVTQPDTVFPYFVVHEIPFGFSGLFIASIFAAGISTLDTYITEAADVSVRNIYARHINKTATAEHYIFVARIMMLAWGILFGFVALFFSQFQSEGLLDLTFKIPNYVSGILLGTIILARLGIGKWRSYLVGMSLAAVIIYVLQGANVSFFWWPPLSSFAMVMTVWAIERTRPELSGIIRTK